MLVLGREHEVKYLTSLADLQYRLFAFILTSLELLIVQFAHLQALRNAPTMH